MTAVQPDPLTDPWQPDPQPWDEPPPWTGGNCATHGSAFREDCDSCPPAGHPLYDHRLLRRERA